MSELLRIITSDDPAIRNRSLDQYCRSVSTETLLGECDVLNRFRRESDNLYHRVRALFFLYAIHRFHLAARAATGPQTSAHIPYAGYANLLNRRFEEAIHLFCSAQSKTGLSSALSSALAAAYRALGFQTLANQVQLSVRSLIGNRWMFRVGQPADTPLSLRPELLRKSLDGAFPILRERTPVRMDLTHSGWSDIFFLGMDFPEGARVLNVSIDLALRNTTGPVPPVEAYLRVIDEPVIRLTSIDLEATVDVTSIAELFDFARDYLGLLKAAVIAAGIVPPGMEGATRPLGLLLDQLTRSKGMGIEIVSKVNNIPKGSRLAVSTNLLACVIAACMRATGQIRVLVGRLEEDDRRIVAARAILGEWLGGSGGGWQDSGGVWPGMKLIQGVAAAEGDPEYGISRGRLLPRHHILTREEVSAETRQRLQDSLILVHGGMAQDVGPILEMVTEKYLLRSEAEWAGRQSAIRTLDQILGHLTAGEIRAIGKATEANFEGPIQTIIPAANNLFTQTLIDGARAELGENFWGFWMLGGMSGGGMGFIVDPRYKAIAQDRLQALMSSTRRKLERALPFAMEPVVYDFAINENGTFADLLENATALMPPGYYSLFIPRILRNDASNLSPTRQADIARLREAVQNIPEYRSIVRPLFNSMLPQSAGEAPVDLFGSARQGTLDSLLTEYGFDPIHHAQIQAGLRNGRIGLAQNRLPASTVIDDVLPEDVLEARGPLPTHYAEAGREAIAAGAVAVVTFAGGVGSRWTRGAGVVKALSPFHRFGTRFRSFLEVHLAKSRRTSREYGTSLPHVFTTSYMTHNAIRDAMLSENRWGYEGPLLLSPGRTIGLRMVPTERDLRFAWEETLHQVLDEQAQKVRQGLHSALISWTRRMGEASDYTANDPAQCLHPVGHWYEIANMLRNGVLLRLLEERPQLRYLMAHNVDTCGVSVDPAILGLHMESKSALSFEVISRHIEDSGGGLARVDGRVRLVEGMALPRQDLEFGLSFYNSNTCWIDIELLLQAFSLHRDDLHDDARVSAAIRGIAGHMPTYITLKDVKKRWGRAQEDIYPVAQFEKLWVDMTALPGLACQFLAVSRKRGQQLKEVSQLDSWVRDGSAAYVDDLCDWNPAVS